MNTDNRHGGANAVGHDEKSLRVKRACFDSRGTLPESGFVIVDKPLLGLWSRKPQHPTPGNFNYLTPTPGRFRSSAVFAT